VKPDFIQINPLFMPVSAVDMVKAAKAAIQNLTPQQVHEELQSGEVTLIDIREPAELEQNGKIAGSTNAPRGMLEFYADETLPYHKPEFDRSKRIILHCASGGRSALATQTLMQMGYSNIAHLDGGINAWKEAGLPVE
jgi:rhodanese-related sulfurtransferase